jgi:predicted ATPase
VVLLSGEAGIGKTTLVEALRAYVTHEGYTRVGFRSSPYHTHSALYPVIEHLRRVLRLDRQEAPETALDKLERALQGYRFPQTEIVPLLAALLAVPLPEGRYATLTLTPQQQRQQTLDALMAWLVAEAERHPVLAVYEDVHWADPSTLELLGMLVEQAPTTPMLHVLVFRPDFVPPWPPRAYITPLTLNRLDRPQVETLIRHLAGGKVLPAEVVQHIVTRTDGVPLFVEELTRMLLESGRLQEDGDRYVLTGPLASVPIPTTLHDSLMARLDRLSAAKEIAQLGAVLGREFSYVLIQALALLDEATLQARLEQLVAAELLYQRGRLPRATYVFKHALIQDAAYASLLKSTRQQVHQQVARVLEAQFPETVATQPELVAHHYTEAGCPAQAIAYWQRAGQQAAQRSAHQEAIGHLTKGVEVLQTLPDTPERTQQDLLLHVALGVSLMAVKGRAAPEVERVYTRAWALCQQVGDTPQLFPVLRGLYLFYLNRGERQTAQALAEQLLRQAERQPQVAPRMLGHYLLGLVLFQRGALGEAVQHFAQAIAAYDFQEHCQLAHVYGTDLGVITRSLGALVLWVLGYPDRALIQSQEALTLARQVAHPLSLVLAQVWLACLHQFRQEARAAHDRAAGSLALAAQQGFSALFVAWGTVPLGWALMRQGQWATGLAKLREGSAAALASGSEQWRPYYLALLAEAAGAAGQPEDGLRLLAEAQDVMTRTDERFYEAELSRLMGVLHLTRSPAARAEAESHMRHALNVARRQQAKSWELRAATSLSRLWQQQGKRAEAHELLAPIYGWFTEGFDTPDLQDAKALLDELA